LEPTNLLEKGLEVYHMGIPAASKFRCDFPRKFEENREPLGNRPWVQSGVQGRRVEKKALAKMMYFTFGKFNKL
jgi:hypothetical protein